MIEHPNAVLQTPDGGYLVGGMFSMANEARRAYLMKIDGNGDSLWTKLYPYSEQISALYFDNNNDLRGIFETSITGMGLNLLFAKLDPTTGDTISTFRAPKPTNADNYRYRAHVLLPDGSYVLSAQGEVIGSYAAGYLLRFTPGAGTATWYADSLAQKHWVFNDMILDGQSVVLTGSNGSPAVAPDFLVAKYDISSGSKQWQRIFYYDDGNFLSTYGSCIVKNSQGNYVAGGGWRHKFGNIIGINLAFFHIGTNGDSLAMHEIYEGGAVRKLMKWGNNLLAAGQLEKNDTAPDNSSLHHTDIALFVLNDDGSLGNTTHRFNNAIFNQTSNGYISSHWSGYGLMVNAANEILIYGQGAHLPAGENSMDQNTFIAKLTPNTTGVDLLSGNAAVKAFPNPFTDMLTVTGKDLRGMVHVSNIYGQEVARIDMEKQDQVRINTSAWPAGMYFLHGSRSGNTQTIKLIKQ